MKTQRTNRKKRSTFVQVIGKSKQITHKRGTSLKQQQLPILTEPYFGTERTQKRKRERDRGILVWNSKKYGTYERKKHGELVY